MTHGVMASLSELIQLQRYAQPKRSRVKASSVHIGQYRSIVRGRGMDFSETRHYQAGDEIRHMEWRVTARTGRPHVKVYHEERERPVVLVVDFNASMYFGTRVAFKSVVAARLAALVAWTVAKQGDRVGGLLFSETSHHAFTPRNRQAGVLPLLSGLSQYTCRDPAVTSSALAGLSSLNHALLRVQRVAKPGSLILVISDFYTMDTDTTRSLSRLRQHNDVLMCHVCDPLECNPPYAQHYAMTNGQQVLEIDTTLDSVRFGYQFGCDHRINEVETVFKQQKMPYRRVLTSTNLPRWVQETFPWKVSYA